MNMMQENASEDNKYAFLLGSALRNDDTDQLFTVYDDLIPPDISPSRLQRIKEQARCIAEIPEEDFNALVLNARDYSLASGGHYSMSSHTGYGVEDEESSKAVGVGTDDDLGVAANNSAIDSHEIRAVSAKDAFGGDLSLDLPVDEDSGLPASKATGSLSENFDSGDVVSSDDDDERPGAFDYMPSQSGHVKIRSTHNPHYDEEVKVGSSTGESSIESPRSENSLTYDEYNMEDRLVAMEMGGGGWELQDMSRHNSASSAYHNHHLAANVSEHKRLYGPGYTAGGQSLFHSFSEDEMADDEDRRRMTAKFHSSSRQSRPPTEVHQGTDFFKHVSGIDVSRAASHFQKAEAIKLSYNCYDDSMAQGDGVKSKKKGGSKGDSDRSLTNVDINGNPQPLDPATYRQMRSPPSFKTENGPSSNQLSHGSQQENSKFEEKKRAKERKKQRQQSKLSKSNECQNYQGENDLNYLLEYIEGKSAHKSSTSPSGSGGGGSSSSPTSAIAHASQAASSKQAFAAEASGVRSEKAKRKQDKGPPAAPKERHNDAGEKGSGDPVLVNGQDFPVATTKSGEGVANTLLAKAALSQEIIVSNILDSFLNSVDTCAVSEKGKVTSEQMDTAVQEAKTPTMEVDDPLTESNPGKTQVNNKKQSKPKEDTSVVSKRDKAANAPLQNGPSSPDSGMGISDHHSEVVSVDSSLSSDVIPGFEINSELKRELAFTEVKKKKKRPGTARETPSMVYPGSHSIPSNNSFMYKNNGSSFRQRPQTVTSGTGTVTSHVTTPAASNTSPSLTSSSMAGFPINYIETSHTLPRDLSPSAFPVLSGHGKQNSSRSDGRRNSCGDISSDIADTRVQYDSDKESVKSLPAARDTRTAGDSSPMYLVTYASMAAAPRRSDISSSPGSELGGPGGSQNSSTNGSLPPSSMEITCARSPVESTTPDRKTTVWKGSPRERRHSEGDNSSLNQRSRQKSGSQECLAGVLAAADPGSSTAMNVIYPSCSSSSLPSDVSLQDGVSNPTNQSTAACIMAPSSSSTPSLSTVVPPPSINYANQAATSSATQASSTANMGNTTNPSRSTSSASSGPSSQREKSNESLKTAAPKQCVNEESENSFKKPEVSKKGPSAAATTTTTTTTNSKSVIFLDKRFGGKSQNLDITFGFDSSIQPASETDNKSTPHLPPSSHVVSLSSPVSSTPAMQSSIALSSTSGEQSPSSPQVFTSIPSLMASPQLPAHVPSPHPPSSDTQVDKNSNMKNKVPKGPHLLAGSSNGIILPAKTAIPTQTIMYFPSASAVSEEAALDSRSKQSGVSSSSSVGNNVMSSSGVTRTMNTSVGSQNSKMRLPSSSKCLSSNSSPISTVRDSHNPSLQLTAQSSSLGTAAVNVRGAAPTTPDGTTTTTATATTQASIAFTGSAASAQAGSAAAKSKPPHGTEANRQTKLVEVATDQPSVEVPSSKHANAVRVVYGLKIKPAGGCGSLLFVPSAMPKRQKRDNASEIYSFMRRQWSEVQDPRRKHSPVYITVAEN